MTRVADRPGHDVRYALTNEKLTRHTGWMPTVNFDEGLEKTIDWYRASTQWTARVKTGEYRRFYELNYSGRKP